MGIINIQKASLIRGSAAIDDDKRSITDVYIVTLDAKPADLEHVATMTMAYVGEEIMGYSAVVIGDPYGDPTDGDPRRLKSVTPAMAGTVLDYIVEFQYETPDSDDDTSSEPNPLLRPDTRRISGSSSLKPYFKDNTTPTAKSVVNAAGEPFQTLRQRYCGQFEIVITGNRATFDPAWADYVHPEKGCAVNSDTFTIRGITIAAGRAIMLSINSSSQTENGTTYDEMEWRIGIASTWDDEVENRGFHELSGGKLYVIKGDNGVDQVQQPYPLNETGQRMASPTATPSTLTFKPYRPLPFGIFTWTASA